MNDRCEGIPSGSWRARVRAKNAGVSPFSTTGWANAGPRHHFGRGNPCSRSIDDPWSVLYLRYKENGQSYRKPPQRRSGALA